MSSLKPSWEGKESGFFLINSTLLFKEEKDIQHKKKEIGLAFMKSCARFLAGAK